jgi:hypothetical protein
MAGIATGLAFLSGLGLPQVLLWLLTFAIVFELATRTGVVANDKVAALVALIVGLLVLMAAPTAVITAISTMSTGMIVAAIAGLVVLSIFEVGQITKPAYAGKDEDGKEKYVSVKPHQAHSTIAGVIAFIVAIGIFVMAGGPALIGIPSLSLPFIPAYAWFVILAVAAVYWVRQK